MCGYNELVYSQKVNILDRVCGYNELLYSRTVNILDGVCGYKNKCFTESEHFGQSVLIQ